MFVFGISQTEDAIHRNYPVIGPVDPIVELIS